MFSFRHLVRSETQMVASTEVFRKLDAIGPIASQNSFEQSGAWGLTILARERHVHENMGKEEFMLLLEG
jgi:hypothetical protein